MAHKVFHALQDGETLMFKRPDGEVLVGVVNGRSWAFQHLLSYQVTGEDGKRYSVNPRDFTSGHSY